jgi:hypothetical protein
MERRITTPNTNSKNKVDQIRIKIKEIENKSEGK